MKRYIDDDYEKLLKVLAHNISFYRTRKGLSQEDLSYAIGKPRKYISSIESLENKKEMDSKTAIDIAIALDISLDRLVRKRSIIDKIFRM